MFRSAKLRTHPGAARRLHPLPMLHARTPDIVEYRGSRVLIVWGDIPYWRVVDTELFKFLSLLQKGATLHDAARTLAYRYGHTICSTHQRLKKLLPDFISAGVIYRDSPRVKEPVRGKIENITVNITRRCNLSCPFCYNRGYPVPAEEAPVRKILRFLEQALPFTANECALTILGGEPTLRKDETLELARWGAQNGFATTVSTNGLLVDREFARAAAACGMTVQVSIDGPTMYEHETLRGRDTFARARKAARILARNGVRVVTNMVVHEDNQWRIEDYFRFSKRLGAAGVRFVPLRCIGGGHNLRPPDLIKLLHSTRTILALRRDFRNMASEDWFTTLASTCRASEKRTSCGIGERTLLVEADGSVYPCTGHAHPEFRLGSVTDSFRKIWRGSALLDGLRSRFRVDRLNGKCAKCPVRHWCVAGCRGEAYARTGSCFEPTPSCAQVRECITEMFWILSEARGFDWQTNTPCSGK